MYGEDPIEINAGRRTVRIEVENTGDRAIQIGSHYHFFEVNPALRFDRDRTLGMHLNIASGTSVRVEPGGTREVELCEYAGTGRLVGFSGLLNGSVVSHPVRIAAFHKALEQGFQGAAEPGTEKPKGGGKGKDQAKGQGKGGQGGGPGKDQAKGAPKGSAKSAKKDSQKGAN
nr:MULTISPECIES: urease subunit beta [unclassified Streptomyces]